jgi:GT2 family glycosyltransferase
LNTLRDAPNFIVLSNATNRGFVGAVNRALRVASGDVILLNADTIVPSGFIERLNATARSDATIGTITPLSNNGEFTSFPLVNKPNPMPSAQALLQIDGAAGSREHRFGRRCSEWDRILPLCHAALPG